MLPNLKLIKKYYSNFFCTILFLLTAMLPLGRNNFIFEKSMYFPVIPDNSHDLLRSWHQSFWYFLRNNFLTSWITYHLLHVIDHACWILLLNKRRKRKKTEKNTQNTFIEVLSVLKFVLGDIQRECLSTHYKNHWEFSIGLPCFIWLIGH